MSETSEGVAPVGATTAGSLLRQARQAQGMHIAVLAASIKVTQRKLEALEADRLGELPDATFTRALAQTVCRTLKIDAAPVLALLPPPPGHRLEHVAEGINAPFRERSGHEARDWSMLSAPALWAPLLLVVAAAIVYFLPSGWLASLRGTLAPAASAPTVVATVPTTSSPPAAEAASAAAPAPVTAAPAPPAASVVVETVHSVPATPAEAASAAVAEGAPQGVLHIRTAAESWIEVLDGRGQTLISRIVQPGEAVGLDGTMPLKVTIGNAAATQVSFRGKALDLAPHTRRDNVARLDLK